MQNKQSKIRFILIFARKGKIQICWKQLENNLSFAGVQYRNPDKAGDEREKMLDLRQKAKKLESLLQNWPKPSASASRMATPTD